MKFPVGRLVIAATAVIVLTTPASLFAFYEWNNDYYSTELQGVLRIVGVAASNPEGSDIYSTTKDGNAGFIGRLIINAQAGDHFSIELNAYNLVNHSTFEFSGLLDTLSLGDTERSPALETVYTGEGRTEGRLVLDRALLEVSYDRLGLIAGRQPINLSTCFYFTPNDFFAPFTAQTFYRLYKSGVDAIRLETRLANLTQLTIVGVLGYETDKSTSNGYSAAVSKERSSAVARLTTSAGGLEWAIMGGHVRQATILGGSIQGDIFGGRLGVRAEGHYSSSDSGDKTAVEAAMDIEHRFENTLTLRLSQFYHGSGSDNPDDYLGAISDGSSGAYLGRRYMALGAGYELSPLTIIEAVGITNCDDGSLLLSFNTIHSLADEAELSWGFSIPAGEGPEGYQINSEFGTYPWSINMEIRYFF